MAWREGVDLWLHGLSSPCGSLPACSCFPAARTCTRARAHTHTHMHACVPTHQLLQATCVPRDGIRQRIYTGRVHSLCQVRPVVCDLRACASSPARSVAVRKTFARPALSSAACVHAQATPRAVWACAQPLPDPPCATAVKCAHMLNSQKRWLGPAYVRSNVQMGLVCVTARASRSSRRACLSGP